jgi:DNA-binding PadR family transcriptional regulator
MGKNEVDLIVLGVLLPGPAHGYQIKRRIESTFGDQYPNLSDSAVYPRLVHFEKEGYVISQIERQTNAPNRKVYQLTATGGEEIRKLVATPIKVNRKIGNSDVDNLVIHIMFFSMITKGERRKVIEPFYNFLKQQHDAAVLKLEKYRSEGDKFAILLFEYRIPSLEIGMDMYQKLMDLE